MNAKTIEFVVQKRCIDFNGEFRCPECNTWLYPVCVNLGMVGKRFYCSSRRFKEECPQTEIKYLYMAWKELAIYRLMGRLREEE